MPYATITNVSQATAAGYVRIRATRAPTRALAANPPAAKQTILEGYLAGESGAPKTIVRFVGEGATFTASDAAAVLSLQGFRNDRYGPSSSSLNNGVISGSALWSTKDV